MGRENPALVAALGHAADRENTLARARASLLATPGPCAQAAYAEALAACCEAEADVDAALTWDPRDEDEAAYRARGSDWL